MKWSLITILSLLIVTTYSQIPPGYYDSAIGLTGDQLKAALHNIIDNHTEKSYGDARYILDDSDKDPNNSSNVRTIYSPHSVNGTWDSGVTWNREHVWSKSRGIGSVDNDTYGAGSDIHNLRACIPQINTDKSNRWFVECDTKYNYSSSWTGSYYAGSSWSSSQFYWKPRDEDKGDVARIMFYMATRYEGDVSGEPDLELIDYIPSDNSTTNPIYALFSDLYQWHLDDPVDDFERNRNNVIYSHQGNRNPYIDHPEYVKGVWFGILGFENDPELEIPNVYPNPSSDYLSIFGLDIDVEFNYEIFNSAGQKIQSGVYNDKINTQNMAKGLYCIVVSDSRIGFDRKYKLTFLKQ